MSTTEGDTDSPDEGDESTRPVAQNPKRGCGHLKHGKGYVRSAPDALDLPAFVEMEPHLPYKEGHFRGFKHFPGYQFELAVMDRVEFSPRSVARQDMGRMYGIAEGDHMGEMDVIRAHDLIMWAGKTYYDPDEFVQEVRKLGLSKAIPLSKNQEPPTIVPGWTRCWILHMEATEDNKPGLLGYAPLGEVVYTEDDDGQVPKWAQDYDAAGKLTLAKVGPEVSAEATQNHALGDYDGITIPGNPKETEAKNTTLREVAEAVEGGDEPPSDAGEGTVPDMDPVSVEPTDKPGRDVTGVSDSE